MLQPEGQPLQFARFFIILIGQNETIDKEHKPCPSPKKKIGTGWEKLIKRGFEAVQINWSQKFTLYDYYIPLYEDMIDHRSYIHNLSLQMFAHVKNLCLKFSRLSCVICVNLLYPWTSLFFRDITIYLVFFYLSKLLFSGFLQFEGNFVPDQFKTTQSTVTGQFRFETLLKLFGIRFETLWKRFETPLETPFKGF